jgi:hypothetical protein
MQEKKEQYLGEAQAILKLYHANILKALEIVRDQNISDYPLLVLHKVAAFEVGILFATTPQNWEIRVSTAEEFAARQIILTDKIQEFLKIYRQHQAKNFVVFVLTDIGADYLFIPQKGVSERR